jgi:peptide/nickel transport system substrate-binding protein
MRRYVASRGVALALTLIIGVSFAAIGSTQAQQPKKGGTLVYASVSGPGTLDPYMASSAVELEVIHNLFESLVTLDAGNDTRPMLAAKAAASEDFKTYTFELRKGVKFHNGQEMTANDVKASMDHILDKDIKSPTTSIFAAFKEIQVIDPQTVRLVLNKTDARVFDILANNFAVLPAQYIKDVGAPGIA